MRLDEAVAVEVGGVGARIEVGGVQLWPAGVDPNLPVVVPQVAGIPFTLYGHSQCIVPAAWVTDGLHWSQTTPGIIGSGAWTNRAVGGWRMEDICKGIDAHAAGAYGQWSWPHPATPTICLVDCVFNSAAEEPTTRAFSVESMKQAARVIAVAVLSERFDNAHASVVSSGFWNALPDALSHSGSWLYTSGTGPDHKVTWTVPAGVDAAMAWLQGITFNSDYGTDQSVGVIVTVNGVERVNGFTAGNLKDPQPSTAAEAVDFMKMSVPIGPVEAGDVVVVYRASGNLFFVDGFAALGDLHHVAFVADNVNINSATYPAYSVAAVSAHNAALDALKAEFDAFAPGGVSVLDLSEPAGYDRDVMLWTGDGLHYDDDMQPLMERDLSHEMLANIPQTARLDNL